MKEVIGRLQKAVLAELTEENIKSLMGDELKEIKEEINKPKSVVFDDDYPPEEFFKGLLFSYNPEHKSLNLIHCEYDSIEISFLPFMMEMIDFISWGENDLDKHSIAQSLILQRHVMNDLEKVMNVLKERNTILKEKVLMAKCKGGKKKGKGK